MFSFGGALPLNLCSLCTTSIRHGGIEPAIMPTENLAVVQFPKVTRFPVECHFGENQDGESQRSTYMLDRLLSRGFLSK